MDTWIYPQVSFQALSIRRVLGAAGRGHHRVWEITGRFTPAEILEQVRRLRRVWGGDEVAP